ncbi:Gamma-tubulin complex component 4-like [Homarus americanus]|uniref:Gamma-tubulin complex component n=1 Tax=Homarus americanus TaxID=6706 RepID=A0A8J5K494_HOMAM|nr:Gamma-tubulin complex component 4-like [Homarus americanus]
MLHDLISAVKGIGGDMFVGKEDFRFEVSNDLGFLHPNKKHRCGLYLSSLAAALLKTAQTFHTTVVELEYRLLSDPHLPLSELLLTLQPTAPLLASLSSLVTQIEEKNAHGCMILEVLHKHTANSVAHVKQVLMRVEQEVHSVLFDQLTHWLLHGLLLDPHHELFIHFSSNEAPSEIQQMDALSLEGMENLSLSPECMLRLEMLPSHIPLSVAEKILFIGEAILVFEREAKKENGVVDTAAVSSLSGQVLKSREEEFKALINTLGQEPTFSIIQFSQVIETIRHCISQELWKLVMGAGLVAEVGDLKAVFLLGRGELYQTLIPSVTPYLLNSAPNANFDGLFQLAGRQVLLEEGMLEKFTLSLKTQLTQSSQTKEQPDKSWRSLRLDYHAKWPLHKLFTSAVQDKYNAIFTFLLDVRRAQFRLQQLWITQMRTKFQRKSEADRLQWTLRHHMSLLIDNIQYYLQVDVLESQHWQLIAEIGKTHDYQHLVRAHHNFLVSVSAQCFLNNTLVSNCLQHLLKLIHKFCSILESLFNNDSKGKNALLLPVLPLGTQPVLLNSTEQIKELNEAFERAAARLFFVLSNLRLHQGSQYTSQLIMRIDYNKYYSKNTAVRRFKPALNDI